MAGWQQQQQSPHLQVIFLFRQLHAQKHILLPILPESWNIG